MVLDTLTVISETRCFSTIDSTGDDNQPNSQQPAKFSKHSRRYIHGVP